MKLKHFVAPGITIGFLIMIAGVTAGLGLIIEKQDGMHDRTKVAGVTTFEIMLSHFIPQAGLILVQAAIAFAIMFLAFEIHHVGSIPLAFCLTVWAGTAGVLLGNSNQQLTN